MSTSKRSRRHFTTDQKVALLQRHLVDKEPVSKICDENQLQPSVFYDWLRQAFANLSGALAPPAAEEASRREKEQAQELAQLKSRLAKKDSVIAEISAEYVALKKELGEP
jgi:transposase